MRHLVALQLLVCLSTAAAVRNLQIASPLYAFTIWDKPVDNSSEVAPQTRRRQFLDKFKVGLRAETAVRQELADNMPPPPSKAVSCRRGSNRSGNGFPGGSRQQARAA